MILQVLFSKYFASIIQSDVNIEGGVNHEFQTGLVKRKSASGFVIEQKH